MSTTVWIEALAGVAGDMLAGALVDAGVPLDVMSQAVEAVLPGAVRLSAEPVLRKGFHATKFEVTVLEADAPLRHLTEIRALLGAADLPTPLQTRVLAVFNRLAAAEAAAHGTSIDEVHFHEIGAADSITDIVAVCAALHWLDAAQLCFGEVALGSGTVKTEHGTLPVPTPAALQLTRGLLVQTVGNGELATPTGLALLTALGEQSALPRMRISHTGTGAGTKDFPDRANVVRVVIGTADPAHDTLVIETNVDDMDPRLWPAAIDALLRAGASDAWLTPIVMKKGRPAHTLTVLCARVNVDPVLNALFRETSTIGARVIEVDKVALDRRFEHVDVEGHPVAVKLAGRLGRIYNVSLEFDDLARAATALDKPQRVVLAQAQALAVAAGFVTGAEFN